MSELMVIGFEGTHRAAEILNELQWSEQTWATDLRDAVAVYRTTDGKLRLDQSLQATTKEGAGWGGLLGGFLGALLAAPLTAGVSVPATAAAIGVGGTAVGALTGAAMGADDASRWKEYYGVSEDFVQQVGGMVQPGQSAIFVRVRAVDPEVLAGDFRGHGGKILRTSLPPEKAERFQQILSGERTT
jgi:uncharacterized membrane protein